MDALVEIHDEQEMHRALALGARMIGINNRNLKDLTIDLGTTERLAVLAGERVLVSESGINDRLDIERLSNLVDGFLVGTSLMRAGDPAQAARELVFGRTKICGLNCEVDTLAARPAAFAGFVFVAASPRQVNPEEAAPLARSVRSSGTLPVGVFRDESIDTVSAIARSLDLHAVQLHGREDAQYVRLLRSALPQSCEIWTALSVGRDALTSRGGDRLLFDNGEGGSGKTFDWAAVKGHPELHSAILAGGIGPHNANAAQRLGAYAIDVGSSVDRKPGSKSPEKIAELFEALRPLSRQRVSACA
jgi:indole-3-glycerol phosphate synthase/phosphoribosylanthranilate isomerase